MLPSTKKVVSCRKPTRTLKPANEVCPLPLKTLSLNRRFWPHPCFTRKVKWGATEPAVAFPGMSGHATTASKSSTSGESALTIPQIPVAVSALRLRSTIETVTISPSSTFPSPLP